MFKAKIMRRLKWWLIRWNCWCKFFLKFRFLKIVNLGEIWHFSKHDFIYLRSLVHLIILSALLHVKQAPPWKPSTSQGDPAYRTSVRCDRRFQKNIRCLNFELFVIFEKKMVFTVRWTLSAIMSLFHNYGHVPVRLYMWISARLRLGCPRDLKSGNRKKHSITVLTFSVISNILWELDSEFWACAEI